MSWALILAIVANFCSSRKVKNGRGNYDIPECGTVSDRAVLKLSMIDSAGTSTEVKFSKAV